MKYVKNLFLAMCGFTALYFLVQLYLTAQVNAYEKKGLKRGPSPLVLIHSPSRKSKGSLNSPFIKKTRKDKHRKNVSKKKATSGKQKKKNPPHSAPKSLQKKKMTSFPVIKFPQMKVRSQKKRIASPLLKKSPQIKLPLSVKYNGSLLDKRKFLAVLATTWLPEQEKENVHENVARVWGSWPGIVQAIVYTNLSMTDTSFNQCMKSGWKFSPIQKTTCAGIPVLKSMMTDILKNLPNSDFYGFANSDILFDPGLIETLKFVKKHIQERPVMLIGQRLNVDFVKPLDVHSAREVPQLAKKGKIMREYAIDYFLTDRSFPWDKLPDLVIGRHQYDNYLVHFGLMQNASVIDVTQTVMAVHQTTKDGNNSGNHRHDKNCNRQMIKKLGKPFYSSWGFVTCARKYTHNDTPGNIIMSSREPWRWCRPSPP